MPNCQSITKTKNPTVGCNKKSSCQMCNTAKVYDWLKDVSRLSKTNYNIVEVGFKGFRTEFFYLPANLNNIQMNDYVIVEANGYSAGYDLGKVTSVGEIVRLQMRKKNVVAKDVSKKILRLATDQDLEKNKEIQALEYNTLHKARKTILKLGLNMKLSEVNYQFNLTRATFYYTADSRIDFRELIKKLAENFKVRIEMRQISRRHEAKRLDSLGPCGRELCCSSWIHNFKNVSIAAARYQNISINIFKLAGQCGKLKCCLNYELETYLDAIRDIPTHINKLKTKQGDMYLQKIDIFKRIMWFSGKREEIWTPLEVSNVIQIKEMNNKNKVPESLKEFCIEPNIKEISLGYGNTIKHDSITRMDKFLKNKNKSKNAKNQNQNKRKKS